MKKIVLKVAYIGTAYHGFQRQPDLPTVESELINALKEANIIESPREARFQAAGRTDKGVHSLGNLVAFFTPYEVHVNQINDILPRDIKVLASASVYYGFKVRYPIRRYYRYILFDGDLDMELMSLAASKFEGTHDFTNFSKRVERNPIRRIESVKIQGEDDYYIIDVVGESFLWQMVRKMVKVIADVGRGKIEPENVDELLNPGERIHIEPMPPENLILMGLEYGVKIKFKEDEYAISSFKSMLDEEFLEYKKASIVRKVMRDSINNIIKQNN
ncbi:MAG TPA: tRNA pseudouridine(38-40) synthase TruA [Methanothermobacter sp.]|nr:tRNA pseudouridine synthase A [Methanothermobacter sp. MT-2]HHW05298.1 tRNA pseudouridine(38-40) synthase TruA [Methanothermobacter sp.]HOK72910.1 tRNA pseudouridine(38-40) synthase TruA [Methanothermobacter sp.]HOL69004.1 tRNA pseudouridine(38-40) synthase TruA [Methanothermobacter sp.]HPQ04859.1 tRNA pseudouridine(38-40) synthase TruA [Methanothermobacter sp.]